MADKRTNTKQSEKGKKKKKKKTLKMSDRLRKEDRFRCVGSKNQKLYINYDVKKILIK